MLYKTHSFRNAEVIFENNPLYIDLWQEVKDVIKEITDDELIESFNDSTRKSKKSLSDDLNKLIDIKLTQRGWTRQSPIFNETIYRPTSKTRWWTLDFAKEEIAIEVAFNHGEATAWNLIKPVLSSELNHVEKAIQTSAGIVITASDDLKVKGNFDGATGSYEKFLQYLNPFNNILTVPMMIIGLESPTTFFIDKNTKSVRLI